jgi:hypothetical protein
MYTPEDILIPRKYTGVYVDDTKNCDEVGSYLENICRELQGVACFP